MCSTISSFLNWLSVSSLFLSPFPFWYDFGASLSRVCLTEWAAVTKEETNSTCFSEIIRKRKFLVMSRSMNITLLRINILIKKKNVWLLLHTFLEGASPKLLKPYRKHTRKYYVAYSLSGMFPNVLFFWIWQKLGKKSVKISSNELISNLKFSLMNQKVYVCLIMTHKT